MDNPAELMVGSSMNGPISQAGRKSAERDEGERERGETLTELADPGQAVRSKIIMT